MGYIRIKQDLPNKFLKKGDIVEVGDHLLNGGIVIDTDNTGPVYLDGHEYERINHEQHRQK